MVCKKDAQAPLNVALQEPVGCPLWSLQEDGHPHPPHPGCPALGSWGLIPREVKPTAVLVSIRGDPGTSGKLLFVCSLSSLSCGCVMNVEGREPEGHEFCAPSSERLFPYQSFHKVGLLIIC